MLFRSVLHLKKVRIRFVEALRPKVTASLGVDQLDIDANTISAALNASLQHVADAQLLADLLHADWLAFICKGGVTRDYKRAGDARQIGCQVLGDAIDEVFLL